MQSPLSLPTQESRVSCIWVPARFAQSLHRGHVGVKGGCVSLSKITIFELILLRLAPRREQFVEPATRRGEFTTEPYLTVRAHYIH